MSKPVEEQEWLRVAEAFEASGHAPRAHGHLTRRARDAAWRRRVVAECRASSLKAGHFCPWREEAEELKAEVQG